MKRRLTDERNSPTASERMSSEILIVAGEASGDGHGAKLLRALRERHPGLRAFGMGGPQLAEAGLECLHEARELSVMGIVEVVPKIPRLIQVMNTLVRSAQARRPSCAVLIDAPDFNLRLAARLRPLGIRTIGYVSPMVWAWREGRTKTLSRVLDELLCILPFEEGFLRQRGVNATYVGSPVLESTPPPNAASTFRAQLMLPERRTFAVLPGSRMSELRRLGPLMAEVAWRVQQQRPTTVVVPVALGLDSAAVEAPFRARGVEAVYVAGQAPACVGAADVALVASGTATLEAGLMERPLVCVYRVAPVTYWVGRMLVRLPHFCLVNLLAQRRVVPELLQRDANPGAITEALTPLWAGPEREACLQGLREVRSSLGEPGASARAAARVSQWL
jgi:lipid-A-disaccharide synthase